MSFPDLDKLLGQAGEGWQGLDDLEAAHKAQLEKMRREALEKAQRFEACFSTAAGKDVLEWLLAATVYRRGAWQGQSFKRLDEITGYGLFREGQDSIAWTIVDALAVARGEQPPPVGDGG